MDESAPIRAIVIGVSTLLAVATISAVLMYYNTAKQMASNVGRGQDFAANYEQSIQDILTKAEYVVSGPNYNIILGSDVKNLLNYFYDDNSVDIDLEYKSYSLTYENNTYKAIEGVTIRQDESKAISSYYEDAMSNIYDNDKFQITKSNQDNGKIKLTIVPFQ